ncbi:DUF342 domain-containing protein [Marinospirillum perlucidum]|uniref:DUF342 domain-containing protein n=1 Tax=Marinospirillum perlucidum TaxID=1982602 RepID=UPI000DF18C25|nr:FapA family protein [Marinospirillum perlucidum]
MARKEEDQETPQELPSALELGFAFQLHEDTQELWVAFEPLEVSRELTKEQFHQVVQEAGFQSRDFPLINQNISVLLDAVRRKESKDICISIPVDGRAEVFLNPSKLLAGVVIFGAQGRGKAVDQEQLQQVIKKAKISHGLMEDVLETLVDPELNERLRNTEEVYCTVIAYGEAAYNGQDAWLETLVKDASDRRPLEDETGRVDFLDYGEFPFIEEDTPLMRRHPPTKGQPGMSVTGKTLRAKDGKDIQFRIKDASVKTAEDDEDLLVAASGGIPVISDKGVHIEQLLKIDKVDIETGHVRYRGSVEIKGDVRDGMQVIATGDIKIGGVVDAAFIKSGGHIECVGGVIGHTGSEYITEKAALVAECSIKARFAHEARMQANQEIIIGNQVMHSQLVAGSYIQVQGKGQVVGGHLKAADSLEMSTSGALAYTETHLEVGECSKLEEEYTELLGQLKHLEDQKYQLIELARKTRKAGKEELAKKKDQLIRAKETLQFRSAQLNKDLHELEEKLKRFYAAKIQVNRRAYPGTLLKIAGRDYEVSKELDKVTFILKEDKVQTRQ